MILYNHSLLSKLFLYMCIDEICSMLDANQYTPNLSKILNAFGICKIPRICNSATFEKGFDRRLI